MPTKLKDKSTTEDHWVQISKSQEFKGHVKLEDIGGAWYRIRILNAKDLIKAVEKEMKRK